METHYDAETLMRILTTRILDVVGYDYDKIQIRLRQNKTEKHILYDIPSER